MAVDIQDPRFKLQGNPKQYPRYASHAWRAGFSDCIAVVQRRPGEKLHRIGWDGRVGRPIEYTNFDAWVNDMHGRATQVSGLLVAALLHERSNER